MGIFEFMIAVIGIGTLSSIIHAGMKHESEKLKLKQAELRGGAEEGRALLSDAHAEIAKLKDRVQVLERLATDGDRNLASEIERLRREDRPGY